MQKQKRVPELNHQLLSTFAKYWSYSAYVGERKFAPVRRVGGVDVLVISLRRISQNTFLLGYHIGRPCLSQCIGFEKPGL
jgi:hypothetical protein